MLKFHKKKSFMRFLIILFTFLYVNAQATILVNTQRTIEILPHSKTYHDLGNQETIDTILQNHHKLTSSNKNTIDYCNLRPEGVWIQFELHNPTNQTIRKILKIDNLSTERVDLYKVANNNILSKETTGIFYLKKFHGLVTLNIPININANSYETYYLNVKNEKLSLWFKPELYEPKEFYKEDTFRQIIWALFFGGIFSLVLYNAFLFIFTKDKIYLYYFLYLVATLLQSQFSIYPKLYLFPMDDIEFVKKSLSFNVFYVNVFVTFTMALFIRKFLDTALYPKIDLSLKLLIYIIPLYFVLQIFSIFTIPQVILFQFFTPYYFLWIGFYALYKKNPQAKFFLLGWSFCLMAWLSLFFNIWVYFLLNIYLNILLKRLLQQKLFYLLYPWHIVLKHLKRKKMI